MVVWDFDMKEMLKCVDVWVFGMLDVSMVGDWRLCIIVIVFVVLVWLSRWGRFW